MFRDDFNDAIKNALAARAGFQCSICRKLTIGPSEESTVAVSKTGVAAHIYGAARGRGSRRQDEAVDSAFRSSIENGIWLCSTHAILIDRDEHTFTAEVLLEYKKSHEIYIKLLNAGINVQRGVITKVELRNLPQLGNVIDLEFGDKTIIVGNNGSGKTMICEFIKSLSKKEALNRWTGRPKKYNSTCDIHYFKETEEKYSIHINEKNEVFYLLNDSPIPILEPPLKIFFLSESLSRYRHRLANDEELSLVDVLAGYFSLTKSEFENTIAAMKAAKKYFVDDIYLDDEQDLIVFMGRRKGSFNSFSGGEKDRVMLDIILFVAKYYAKFSSTVLIIERNAIGIIDDAGMNRFLDICRNEPQQFQLILTFFPPTDKLNFEGFTVRQLKG